MAQYFLLVLVLGTAALFILDAGGYLLLRGTKRSLADNHGRSTQSCQASKPDRQGWDKANAIC